jgi:demethylmenaquinone methyltransferase/2-methoxy-6-polyprenyl-1,4-benzoquinol methylase
MQSHSTSFGFRQVDERDKASLVRGVFDSVAGRYDLMNDVMSAGMHRLWKRELVALMAPRDGQQLLDVAGGTGDIAFRLRDAADCHVTVCDINQRMLEEGTRRAIDHNRLSGLEWVCADAQALPFASNRFDSYSIAFGIRNVTHIEQALAEAFRVLKPGGRFFCLEFSRPAVPLLRRAYDAYSFHVIPQLGRMVAGDRESYQYLVESIRLFPPQQAFADMVQQAGFAAVRYRNLTQGVVAIHSGWKP